MKLKQAIDLDRKDNLKKYKSHFINSKKEIYLNGNSLGKLPIKSINKIRKTIDYEWGDRLVRSWNEKWLDLSENLEKKLSTILGATKREIKIGDSTSINLYQIVFSLLKSNLYEKTLISDSFNFPSDNYILEGISSNFNIEKPIIINYSQSISAEVNLIEKTIKKSPGILCLSLVSYKSGWMYPMKELNDYAKKNNSIIVWDLSHAVGATHIDLKKTNTLAAVGCSYKFLNGGPGAPGFLFVDNSIQNKLENPIKGWFGHKLPFMFSDKYEAANNINKFDIGTPGILSMVAMETGLDIIIKATTKSIRRKSISQSEYFISLINQELDSYNVKIESPRDPLNRGSHVTISHSESWKICRALAKGSKKFPKIICDYRPDKFIRFGISPLYTSFQDLYNTIIALIEILKTESYKKIKKEKTKVT